MYWNFNSRTPDVTNSSPPLLPTGNNDLVHFCQLAALVITLYDHFLTLDFEVEYIWKRRWSNLKALFILARYFGDFLLTSICVVFLNRNAGSMPYMFQDESMKMNLGVYLLPRSCDVGLKFVGTGSMVVILITQVIMQLRIKAMYGKLMSRLITIFWILEVIAVLGLGVASLLVIDVTPYTLQHIRMCNPTYLPRFAFLFWVPIIVFETFLFSLALRMAYHNYLEIGSCLGVSLFHVVLRDNFIFFVCAFAIYIITAVTWLSANPRYFTVPGSLTCSFTTIMGCRLILNLCRVYYDPCDLAVRPQSIWAASEGIRFKPPLGSMVADTTTYADWATDGEPSALSSLTPAKTAAYEMSNLVPLDETKRRGEP